MLLCSTVKPLLVSLVEPVAYLSDSYGGWVRSAMAQSKLSTPCKLPPPRLRGSGKSMDWAYRTAGGAEQIKVTEILAVHNSCQAAHDGRRNHWNGTGRRLSTWEPPLLLRAQRIRRSIPFRRPIRCRVARQTMWFSRYPRANPPCPETLTSSPSTTFTSFLGIRSPCVAVLGGAAPACASDALIFLPYQLIPFTFVYLVRRRRDVSFNWRFLCFGMFIIAWEFTHGVDAGTLGHAV
jgi:hypothetical protein